MKIFSLCFLNLFPDSTAVKVLCWRVMAHIGASGATGAHYVREEGFVAS